MAGSTQVQLRVPDDLLARIDEACGSETRTAWLLGLAESELDGSGPDDGGLEAVAAGMAVTHEVPPGGIPSPGVACSWPECWQRDSSRYGVFDPSELTRGNYRERARDPELCGLTLCPAHAARLDGFRYVRAHQPLPRSAARTAQPA